MAIIRDPSNYDITANYLASLALICSISCAILMLKFRGFKASLNFSSSKQLNSEYSENVSPVSVTGAYRLSRDEFFESGNLREPSKKITPSMVKLPPMFQPDPTDPDVIRAKSTSNLSRPANVPTHLSKSTPDISTDPKGGKINDRNSTDFRKSNTKEAKNQEKQQKKLEKQRLADQKNREKIEAQERVKQEKLHKERLKVEAQERAKQEKLKKEREKTEAQRQAKEAKAQKEKDKKKPAPKKRANPLAQGTGAVAGTSPYTTNTLDSSISKTSGPPPYSNDETPVQASNPSLVQNANDDTGNTSFGKPIETDNTWDMIAQHRQQINRAPASGGAKQIIEAKQSGQRFYLTDNNTGVTGRKSLYV